jgi:hypothetical protein
MKGKTLQLTLPGIRCEDREDPTMAEHRKEAKRLRLEAIRAATTEPLPF